MEELLNDEQLLRLYLLGDLAEAEQLEFEVRLLSDKDLLDRLLVEENELVDDYEAGALSEHERERFEGYFLSTPDRQRKVRFAKHLSRYVAAKSESSVATEIPKPILLATPKNKSFYSSSTFRLVAAAMVIAVLGMVVWVVFIRDYQLRKGEEALREATKGRAGLETRLARLDYLPLNSTSVTRGSIASGASTDLEIAKDYLLSAVQDNPSAASLHVLGQTYLLERNLDKAIDRLGASVKADPNNAEFQSDLGAAYLEKFQIDKFKGGSENVKQDFDTALDHLNRAVELDKSLKEALFNRALLYQRNDLYFQAETDWRKYLEVDPNSKWADEAKADLRMIEARSHGS